MTIEWQSDGFWKRKPLSAVKTMRQWTRYRLLKNPYATDKEIDMLLSWLPEDILEDLAVRAYLDLPADGISTLLAERIARYTTEQRTNEKKRNTNEPPGSTR